MEGANRMIGNSLKALVTGLNYYLGTIYTPNVEYAFLKQASEDMFSNTNEKIVVSLVNMEEDAVFKNQPNPFQSPNPNLTHPTGGKPTIRFNLYLLMAESKLIQHIVGRILNVCPAEMIVLFGSFARGEQNENSDVDLIVVTRRKMPRKKVERQIRSSIKRYGVKSDILIRSMEELNAELAVNGSFLQSVFPRGKIVYKKDGFSLQD